MRLSHFALNSSRILSVFAVLAFVCLPSAAFAVDGHGGPSAETVVHDAVEHHGETTHGGDHHEEVDGLPQLNFTTYPSQIFWLFVAFSTLYFIFSKKTLPEISSTIESRREQVEGDLGTAQDMKEEAEKVHEAYDEILDGARKKSSALFVKAEESIKKKANKKLDEFKERSALENAETEKLIEGAKKAAMSDMHSIAAEIASIAAKKIVGVSTDLDKAKDLVKNIDRKAA